MQAKLNIIQCEVCKNSRLVGINGKDIRKSRKSGGKVDDIPYIGISNEEIEKAPALPKEISCPVCSAICKVKEVK